MTNLQDHLDNLLRIVQKADKAVMEVYDSHSAIVTTKADNSPLTQADIASHEIITYGLTKLFPDIPIVSEEGDEQENSKTVQLKKFWLVDPIDGTKEFLNRTGDFTICIALIEGDLPVFGIISAPAHSLVYYGGSDAGSYKKHQDEAAQHIRVSSQKRNIVLASLSHPDEENERYISEHYPGYEVKQVGSQLKLPYIAEGSADAYPRMHSPLHLWDLAAGHAILVGAGGTVSKPDDSPIDYHNETLLVGDFVASS